MILGRLAADLRRRNRDGIAVERVIVVAGVLIDIPLANGNDRLAAFEDLPPPGDAP